jgi:hypothetical protein
VKKHNFNHALFSADQKLFTDEDTMNEFKVDMDITTIWQPFRLVYRPLEIQRLTNFFVVTDLKPETLKQAKALRDSL